MKQAFNLQGLRVLNTRPQHQAHQLTEQLARAGAESVLLPVIRICRRDPQLWDQQLPTLTSVDAFIFTSTNAVDYFFKHQPALDDKWPTTATVAAIGPATARALSDFGIEVVTPDKSDSEHLLQLPLWSKRKRQDIVLITGLDGRSLIKETLRRQGHNVTEIAVYQRERNRIAPDIVNNIWQNNEVDIILVSSAFAMEALFAGFGHQGTPWLQGKTWVVFSQRLATLARQKGVKRILVSDSRHLMTTLFQYCTTVDTGKD